MCRFNCVNFGFDPVESLVVMSAFLLAFFAVAFIPEQ